MIYELCPCDLDKDHYLFFEDEKDRLVIRKEYCDIACVRCGKFDEDMALSRGVSPAFLVKTGRDWFATNDDQICVSLKFKTIYERQGLSGIEFVNIPSVKDYFIASVSCLVDTDFIKAGFQEKEKCTQCGRFQERIIGPLISGLVLPDSSKTIFASKIKNENIKVGYRPVFCSKAVVTELKKERIKGIDYLEAL